MHPTHCGLLLSARSQSSYLLVLFGRRQRTPPHLIQLDTLEQRFKVAFAKTLIAFALNELEKDRAQLIKTENLQQ